MNINNQILKKGWVKFYIIFITVYSIIFSLLLKYKLFYLTPIFVLLFGIIERKFRKGSREVTWIDLSSLIYKKNIS